MYKTSNMILALIIWICVLVKTEAIPVPGSIDETKGNEPIGTDNIRGPPQLDISSPHPAEKSEPPEHGGLSSPNHGPPQNDHDDIASEDRNIPAITEDGDAGPGLIPDTKTAGAEPSIDPVSPDTKTGDAEPESEIMNADDNKQSLHAESDAVSTSDNDAKAKDGSVTLVPTQELMDHADKPQEGNPADNVGIDLTGDNARTGLLDNVDGGNVKSSVPLDGDETEENTLPPHTDENIISPKVNIPDNIDVDLKNGKSQTGVEGDNVKPSSTATGDESKEKAPLDMPPKNNIGNPDTNMENDESTEGNENGLTSLAVQDDEKPPQQHNDFGDAVDSVASAASTDSLASTTTVFSTTTAFTSSKQMQSVQPGPQESVSVSSESTKLFLDSDTAITDSSSTVLSSSQLNPETESSMLKPDLVVPNENAHSEEILSEDDLTSQSSDTVINDSQNLTTSKSKELDKDSLSKKIIPLPVTTLSENVNSQKSTESTDQGPPMLVPTDNSAEEAINATLAPNPYTTENHSSSEKVPSVDGDVPVLTTAILQSLTAKPDSKSPVSSEEPTKMSQPTTSVIVSITDKASVAPDKAEDSHVLTSSESTTTTGEIPSSSPIVSPTTITKSPKPFTTSSTTTYKSAPSSSSTTASRTTVTTTSTTLKSSASAVKETPSEPDIEDTEHNRKRPIISGGVGREGESIQSATSYDVIVQTSANNSTTQDQDLVSRMKNMVGEVEPFYIALTMLILMALTFIACCCCCKVCSKKRRGIRHKRLKEYGKEKEFLLRDRGKADKYSNDSVTLLDGSSEDEF